MTNKRLKINLLRYGLSILSIVLCLWAIQHYNMYNKILKDGGDAWGYYIYLPSFFISKDLATLDYIAKKRKEISPHSINTQLNHLGFGEVYIASNGKPVIKYTSGVAIMLSPFFIVAHTIASLNVDIPNDGFQPIYWLSAYLGVLTWVVLGFVFLYKTLCRYLDKTSAFWTILFIGLGTNLFYFIVYNATMSHAPLFALYCLLIYNSERFWHKPTAFKSILIGVLCGLITMIRPVEIICILIPILWKIESLSSRLILLKKHYKIFLWAIPSFLLAVFPQLLYWKTVTGSWIYYSYGSEGFNFLAPKIWKGLTSYQNGWLIYTPIMIFAIIGLYIMIRSKSKLIVPILIILPIHIYIVYSWHNWYYINAFGSRPMVEMYALLSIPFGYFLNTMKKKKGLWLALSIGMLLTVLNQFQIWQVSKGMMLSEEGNPAYYWSLFGKTKMDERTLTASDTREKQPKESSLRKITQLWYLDMTTLDAINGDGTLLIPANSGQGPSTSISCSELTEGGYLRVSIVAKTGGWNGDRWNMASINSFFETPSGKKYRGRWIRINNKIGNPTWNLWGGEPFIWQEVKYFIKLPDIVKPEDNFHLYINNSSPTDIWIKEFKLELWTKP